MNILHNEFPELDKTYGGFKYFFIIYVVCIECIKILTFKFVFINFFSVCVKLCYVLVVRGWNRVICAWTTSSLDGFGTEAMFFGILSGMLYSCISCLSSSCCLNCITSSIIVAKWW